MAEPARCVDTGSPGLAKEFEGRQHRRHVHQSHSRARREARQRPPGDGVRDREPVRRTMALSAKRKRRHPYAAAARTRRALPCAPRGPSAWPSRSPREQNERRSLNSADERTVPLAVFRGDAQASKTEPSELSSILCAFSKKLSFFSLHRDASRSLHRTPRPDDPEPPAGRWRPLPPPLAPHALLGCHPVLKMVIWQLTPLT